MTALVPIDDGYEAVSDVTAAFLARPVVFN